MIKMVLTKKESKRFNDAKDKRELLDDKGKGTGVFVSYGEERIAEAHDYAVRSEEDVELYLTSDKDKEIRVYATKEAPAEVK